MRPTPAPTAPPQRPPAPGPAPLRAADAVLWVLSALAQGTTLEVRRLLATTAVLGVPENTTRVALARLRARGMVASGARGRYGLGPAAAGIQIEIRAWRHREQQVRPWSGGWVAVHTRAAEAPGRAARAALPRALRVFGFAALEPELYVRPDNLTLGLSEVRDRLTRLGLPASAPVFTIGCFDTGTEAGIRTLWDTAGLEAGYRAALGSLAQATEAIERLGPEDAARLAFRVGGETIRRIVLDPHLPEPLVDTRLRRRVSQAMLRFDDLGRALWRPFVGPTAAEGPPSQEPAS